MARKRLEAAILAGHNIGGDDYSTENVDFISSKEDISCLRNNRLLISNRVNLPLDRWGIYSLQYSPDGAKLAVGFGNGGVCTLSLGQDQVVTEVTHGHRKGLAVMALKYHVENEKLLLSAGASGKINIWELGNDSTVEPVATLYEEDNEVSALDMCCDGKFFATAGKDRHIRIYDASTLQLFHTITAPDYVTMDEVSIYTGHTKRIFALKFHPEENHLFITAGWDDCIKLWDKRMARNARKSIPGPHVCGASVDIRGNTVLTGSWSAKNALQLWDLRAGTLDRNLAYPHDEKAEGEFLYCAKFANSDMVVAGGSGTNTACAISVSANKAIGTVESKKPVLAVDTYNSGKQLAVGGIGGNLQIASLV